MISPDHQTHTAAASPTSDTTQAGAGMLDMETVVAAAQTFASEIVLDTLLEKIMRIVTAHAGAQTGLLVLEQDGALLIEGQCCTASDDVTVLQSLPVESCERLSPAIVNHVWLTGESLLLNDVRNDAYFADDPYIAHTRLQAVICIPVSSRGQRIGILYLEYSDQQYTHADGTFAPQHIEMLHTLIAHAAISLENARLYENMKREIDERKRAEEALRRITEGTASVTGGDFFRSLVRYLAAIFNVRYAMVAECTDVAKTRVRTLAFLGENTFKENFEYDIRGTPCELVVAGDVSYYPERLHDLFPQGSHSDVESYLGAPICNSSGSIVGHMALFDDRPMHRTPYDLSIMQIFAARAGAELERKQTEEAWQQSMDLLQSFLDHSPAAIYLKDTAGRYILLNQRAAQTIGYEREQIISQRDADLFPADLATLLWEHDRQVLNTGTPGEVEETIMQQDGLHTFISVKFPCYDAQGTIYAVGGVSTDITERKQAEAALRESEEQLRHLNEQLEDHSRNLEQKVSVRTYEIERRRQVAEGLHDLLAILNSNRSLDEILHYILEKAVWLLDAPGSAIYRLEVEQARFVVQAARGMPADYVEKLSFPVDQSFLGQAVLRRQPIVITDLSTHAWDEKIRLSNQRRGILATYQALLTVPLIRQGKSKDLDEIYGGIALYYTASRPFSKDDIDLAVAFADQAALALENAQLRQQVKQSAVLEERSRLARELHDSVTQSLYSLTLLAEGWRRLAGSGRLEDAAEPLAELGGIAQQALKEMRLLVHELRPPALEKQGLLGALHERLASVERRAGVDARLLADDVVELPGPAQEVLYRIAQEALNNALKHAAATSVTVHVRANTTRAELEVVDNGQGFDPATMGEHGGIGLTSMQERAEQQGGSLVIESAPGEGTRVWVTIGLNTA
jgi:PAS domain S-box-containing protein